MSQNFLQIHFLREMHFLVVTKAEPAKLKLTNQHSVRAYRYIKEKAKRILCRRGKSATTFETDPFHEALRLPTVNF